MSTISNVSTDAREAIASSEIGRGRRVLLIAPQPFFEQRGTPINIRAMAEDLAAAGFDVHLLVYFVGEPISIPGVTLHRTARVPFLRRVPIGFSARKLLLDVLMLIAASRLLLMRRFAVLHGVEEGAVIAGVVGLLSGTPYISDLDSCMVAQLEKHPVGRVPLLLRGIAAVERYSLRRSKGIVAVCAPLVEKAQKHAPAVPTVQIDDFPLDSSDVVDELKIARLRDEFALHDRRVIVYTGNLERYQGIDLLLEAFSQLADEAVSLLLVGGTVEHIQTYKRRLADRPAIGRVLFAGQRPGDEMGSFMALADVLASPRSEGENTPLKLYSYMASGRPVVATSIPSHTSVLNEDTAFLAPPTAPEFARALQAALDRSDLGRSRSAARASAAKELVERCYSRGAFRLKLQRFYGELLSDRTHSPAEAPTISAQNIAVPTIPERKRSGQL